MSNINIAVAADQSFVQHLAVMLASLHDNTASPDRIKLYVISSELEAEGFNRLKIFLNELNLDAEFIDFDDGLVNDYPVDGHIQISSYYRLFLHQLLPESCEECIYLDADLLVLDDISKFWNIDIKLNAIAGVLDSQSEPRDISLLGLKNGSEYINAGVLKINLAYWRNHKVHGIFKKFIETHRQYLLRHDQDVLNVCFDGAKLLVDQSWNLTRAPAFKSYLPLLFRQSSAMPKIVHYTSAFKPWNRDDPHPLRGLYWKYLKKTPWAGYRMPPITLRQRWNTFYLRMALIYFNLKRMMTR